MNIFIAVFICALAAAAVFGLCAGAVKGFTNVKFWGGEVAFAALFTSLILTAFASSSAGAFARAVSLLICAVSVIVLSEAGAHAVKFLLKKSTAAKYSAEHSVLKEDENFQSENYISGEEETIRKLPLDRFLGAVAEALNCLAVCALILAAAYVAISFMPQVISYGGNFFVSPFYASFKRFGFNLAVCAMLCACLNCGYKCGVSSTVWTAAMLALAASGVYLSYNCVFVADLFSQSANSVAGAFSFIKDEKAALIAAKVVLTCGLSVLWLCVTFLIGFTAPRVFSGLKEYKFFAAFDGALGATFMTGLTVAFFSVLGALTFSMSSFDFMKPVNDALNGGGLAEYFYFENPLNTLPAFQNISYLFWFK